MAAPADEAVEKWLPEETSTKFEESRVGKVFKAVTDLDKTNRLLKNSSSSSVSDASRRVEPIFQTKISNVLN
jgi:hypothetical protein